MMYIMHNAIVVQHNTLLPSPLPPNLCLLKYGALKGRTRHRDKLSQTWDKQTDGQKMWAWRWMPHLKMSKIYSVKHFVEGLF